MSQVAPKRTPWWGHPPGGLFWKVFAACWLTAMLTGLGINLVARCFPSLIELPPVPPSVEQSVLMPLLMGALISGLCAGALAWSLSRPIRILRRAFSDASTGHLENRVTPLLGRQRDEFADLGRDYDRMVEQLQALLSAQRRLLHHVSHELRSPLARLQMAVGLLHRSPQGLSQSLQRIEREVDRLDQLVGEVLTLARLESGAPQGERRAVDVVALLASVAQDAQFEARQIGCDLSFRSEEPSVVIPAHGELLQRAFENVIRNAVKHTKAGTCVDVNVRRHRATGDLHVDVADAGPGLPPEALEHIFQPFVRIETNRVSHGFGLGLAIARQAIESHGGRISARLRSRGGLRLMFVLPVQAGCPPQDARHIYPT